MRIKVRGVTYETVKEAADALGLTINGVYSGLDRGAAEKLGIGKTKPIAITLEGITFRSMTAASIALGFPPKTLRELLRGGPKAQERVRFAAQRYKAHMEMEDVRAASGKGDVQ